MTTIKLTVSTLMLLAVSVIATAHSHAQGLPMQDSPGTSGGGNRGLSNFNDDSWRSNPGLNGGWSNFGNRGRQQVYQPVRQKQKVLVWSTTAYSDRVHPIVVDLKRQGYHVEWRNRFIGYQHYRQVWVTDVYAYVLR